MSAYKIADSVIYAEFDNSWGVNFIECDEYQAMSKRTGFKSQVEAKAYMEGWNQSTKHIADLLLKSALNKKIFY